MTAVSVRPGAAERVIVPRRPARRRSLRRYGVVALFLSPWIVGFFAFIVYPMFASLYYSFTNYDLLSAPRYVGLENYTFMFTKDPQFWQAMRNTLWIIAVGLPLELAFAMATAMLLTRPRRGHRAYRTVYFLPTLAPPVAAALAFVFILNPSIGPVNQVLRGIGIDHPPLWFFDPSTSKWGLVFLGLWGVGQTMIIFLAGLLDVPAHLYEAAQIEGANRRQRFRYVTLPMMSPVVFFSLVIGVIYGFQYFTEAYVVGASVGGAAGGTSSALGSPQGSTLFYTIWLYQQGFEGFHLGYASAMAWMLFVIVLACTLILIKTSNRWVFYQGGFR